MLKTLILDNFDSFTYNLYQYIGELGGNPVTFRNNEITVANIRKMKPTHIVISPGPGTPEKPEDFGICREVILQFGKMVPLLGVCLGHQGIAFAFGGKIIRAPEIMHGKESSIEHTGKNIFKDIPNPLKGMRYHSLIIDPGTFPSELEITAWIQGRKNIIMGIRHKKFPIFGIQFHPESLGTPEGKNMLKNFLRP